MGSSEILRSDSSPLQKLKAATATGLWVALIIVFAPWSLAAAADGPTGTPQIQGGNVRIEFDNHLRSRVVARFDKKDTVMGPFTASETVTTADKPWTAFLLTSQKHEHTKDTFGEGERLTVEGKAGELKKTAGVTALCPPAPTQRFENAERVLLLQHSCRHRVVPPLRS